MKKTVLNLVLIIFLKEFQCLTISNENIVYDHEFVPKTRVILTNIINIFNGIIENILKAATDLQLTIASTFENILLYLVNVEQNAIDRLEIIKQNVQVVMNNYEENKVCAEKHVEEIQTMISSANQTIQVCINKAVSNVNVIRINVEQYQHTTNQIISQVSIVINNCLQQSNNILQQLSCSIRKGNEIAQSVGYLNRQTTEALQKVIIDLNNIIQEGDKCVANVYAVIENDTEKIMQEIKECVTSNNITNLA